MSMDKRGIVVIAHGSRHQAANEDTHWLAKEMMRQGVATIAVAGFLEIAEPDIDNAAAKCVAQGANDVVLVPNFLSAGVHVQRDLTAACRRLAERFGGVRFRLAPPIGRHPLLVEILVQRVREIEQQTES